MKKKRFMNGLESAAAKLKSLREAPEAFDKHAITVGTRSKVVFTTLAVVELTNSPLLLCPFLGRPSFLSVRLQIVSLNIALKGNLGLLTAMFGVAGTLINVSQRAQNQGKVRIQEHISQLGDLLILLRRRYSHLDIQ